jgi:hypothetical protein
MTGRKCLRRTRLCTGAGPEGAEGATAPGQEGSVPATLDIPGLFEALDRKRRRLRMSRAQLAEELGVTPAVITRFGWGGYPAAPTLVKIITWMDRDLREFIDTA